MSDLQYPVVPEAPALTQVQRVVYTFTAPSKTFKDIKRSTSWWLPFLLSVIFSYALFASIGAKVGWTQVTENAIRMSPKQAEQMDKLTPEQRATQIAIATKFTEGIFAAVPVFSILATAVIAAVFFATINFGFGGKATFWQAFAVTWYAGLPALIKVILGIAALFAGAAPESFNSRNFSGTNIGYYLSPDTSKPILALATSFDVVTIWTLVLYSIGFSIIAGTKRSAGYITVFAWWILMVLIGAGWAAAFG
ncbi:YIP1 family protein [Acidicapsa ligni]|uniref:YIP1 family protein n=1 Tax=Acidicapsa ligni TaxID=542300 RepID=UPI0021DF9F27|nr:YIP1 family protein [Acidicapsa ligni]